MLLVVAAGCGKKGPPLAPFVRVPAAIVNVTGQRIGGDIYLSFTVPSTNVDQSTWPVNDRKRDATFAKPGRGDGIFVNTSSPRRNRSRS